MKPCEEQWAADSDGNVYTFVGSGRMTFLEAVSSGSADRAKLAAAAPDFARLALEFVQAEESRVMTPEERGRFAVRFEAVLAKAGVR